MDIFLVILQSLGTSLGICAVVLVIFLVATMFWVRTAVRSKVYCFFLSESKQMTGGLHKPESGTIIVGDGDDAPGICPGYRADHQVRQRGAEKQVLARAGNG